jgi:hypothetical protein
MSTYKEARPCLPIAGYKYVRLPDTSTYVLGDTSLLERRSWMDFSGGVGVLDEQRKKLRRNTAKGFARNGEARANGDGASALRRVVFRVHG